MKTYRFLALSLAVFITLSIFVFPACCTSTTAVKLPSDTSAIRRQHVTRHLALRSHRLCEY